MVEKEDISWATATLFIVALWIACFILKTVYFDGSVLKYRINWYQDGVGSFGFMLGMMLFPLIVCILLGIFKAIRSKSMKGFILKKHIIVWSWVAFGFAVIGEYT